MLNMSSLRGSNDENDGIGLVEEPEQPAKLKFVYGKSKVRKHEQKDG